MTFNNWLEVGQVIVGVLTVCVALYTAIILLKTLKEGQKQSQQSQLLSSYNVAINQYNILYQDLRGIIERFKNINFKENLVQDNASSIVILDRFKKNIDEANGMNKSMIMLFGHFMYSGNKKMTPEEIALFRLFILFPLLNEYEGLLDFLKDVKNDKILNEEYKRRLFKIIERDILQSYFRICNFNKLAHYDLSVFQQEDLDEFYAINKFYIENDLFQYNDIEFYKNHH